MLMRSKVMYQCQGSSEFKLGGRCKIVVLVFFVLFCFVFVLFCFLFCCCCCCCCNQTLNRIYLRKVSLVVDEARL